MRQHIEFAKLLAWTAPVRGLSGQHRITAEHQAAFAAAVHLDAAPRPPADAELDPLHLLALVRRLLPEAFVITGAAAQELVYLEKVRFVRPVEVGEAVQLSAVFIEALPDDDDLVAVRLGVSLHTVDEELPVFVAEVSLLCGDPPVDDDDATVLLPRRS